MYGKTFVWLNPPKESGLKAGYYIHLLDGEKLQLFCKESRTLLPRHQGSFLVYYFERKVQYYLLYNNRYYKVRNIGSFSKIFPQYKKQINQYAKANRLSFKQDISQIDDYIQYLVREDQQLNLMQSLDRSLISLTGYCDELITSTNK
jgi:hypothetical protein